MSTRIFIFLQAESRKKKARMPELYSHRGEGIMMSLLSFVVASEADAKSLEACRRVRDIKGPLHKYACTRSRTGHRTEGTFYSFHNSNCSPVGYTSLGCRLQTRYRRP